MMSSATHIVHERNQREQLHRNLLLLLFLGLTGTGSTTIHFLQQVVHGAVAHLAHRVGTHALLLQQTVHEGAMVLREEYDVFTGASVPFALKSARVGTKEWLFLLASPVLWGAVGEMTSRRRELDEGYFVEE